MDLGMRSSSPEQKEEAVDLQHHAHDGPADEHHEHTAEEEAGGLHLVLLEEEPERSLQPDDKGEPRYEEDLRSERVRERKKKKSEINN